MRCKLLTVSHKYLSWTCSWLADIVYCTATLSGVFASKHKATYQVHVRVQHYLSTFVFCPKMLHRHFDDRPLIIGMIPGIAMILHTERFLVSAVTPALTIHSHNPYRGRVQDLTALGKWQRWTSQAYTWALIVAGPSNKTLHTVPAHTLYCSRIVFHAPCLIAFKHSI